MVHGPAARLRTAVHDCIGERSGHSVQAKSRFLEQSPSKVFVRGASLRRRLGADVRLAPPVPSFGQMYGLHGADNPLDLKSSVALVMDQDTNEILVNKNSQAVLADRIDHEADDGARRCRVPATTR